MQQARDTEVATRPKTCASHVYVHSNSCPVAHHRRQQELLDGISSTIQGYNRGTPRSVSSIATENTIPTRTQIKPQNIEKHEGILSCASYSYHNNHAIQLSSVENNPSNLAHLATKIYTTSNTTSAYSDTTKTTQLCFPPAASRPPLERANKATLARHAEYNGPPTKTGWDSTPYSIDQANNEHLTTYD